MKDYHHKHMIPPKFVTLPSKRISMGRRISNDSSSNTSSNTNTSSNSKVVVVEEEDGNDHLEGKSNGRHRLHHLRHHSDSQLHPKNPKLRPPSTPDSVASSSSTKSQNKLSTNDIYRPTKHSTNKKCETLPPPKPKSILNTMFFNNNSTTKHPKKKKKTVICKDVYHQYNENGVLRRTTVIRKKRPNGTTATRTHKEFISPTNPKYINNMMTTKRKKKFVRKVEVCVENGQVEK
jgi:hypothetical protein